MIEVDLFFNWISEIIIFLLIATIIDLMIPKNTYHRYVKLVVGLVLLLIFLKPIFHLLNFDVEEEFISKLSFFEQEENREKEQENLLKNRELEIRLGQDAYILEHMENQLIEIAKYQLIDQYQLEITKIDFIFKDHNFNYESLEELIVFVEDFSGEGGIVKPIEEIVIQDDANNENFLENEEEIIELLTELWELTDINIILQWEEA